MNFLSFSCLLFSCSINLYGILDHFGYKAPDFSFIHESIWYDLGCFKNWLIDRRGLNLGDVVPFRSCKDYQVLPSLCPMKARLVQVKKKSHLSQPLLLLVKLLHCPKISMAANRNPLCLGQLQAVS